MVSRSVLQFLVAMLVIALNEGKEMPKGISGTYTCIDVCEPKASLCRCPSTKDTNTIDCGDQSIDTAAICLPKEISRVFTANITLILCKNDIRTLQRGEVAVGIEDFILKMDLSDNEIATIEDQTFQPMTNLKQLNLKNNRITAVNVNTFYGLYNLDELDLSENFITNLTQNPFDHFVNLKMLHLNKNPLINVSPTTFRKLTNLDVLEISYTNLAMVHQDWFIGLTHLTVLDLRYNQFYVVPPLHGLSSIESIDLSGNPIDEINPHDFQGITRLKKLTLNHMPTLRYVERCAFCGLLRLEHFEMRNCSKLKTIEPGAFEQDLYGLDLIDMSNNSLTTLSKDLLHWENISYIFLHRNPWNCDCNLRWMNDRHLNIESPEPECMTPPYLKHHDIQLLNDKDMICQNIRVGSSVRLLFAAVIVLLIAGSLGAAWFLYFSKNRAQNTRLVFFTNKPNEPRYAYRNLAMIADEGTASAHKPHTGTM